MTVNTFRTPDKASGSMHLTIGEGDSKDDLTESQRWLSMDAAHTVDVMQWR